MKTTLWRRLDWAIANSQGHQAKFMAEMKFEPKLSCLILCLTLHTGSLYEQSVYSEAFIEWIYAELTFEMWAGQRAMVLLSPYTGKHWLYIPVRLICSHNIFSPHFRFSTVVWKHFWRGWSLGHKKVMFVMKRTFYKKPFMPKSLVVFAIDRVAHLFSWKSWGFTRHKVHLVGLRHCLCFIFHPSWTCTIPEYSTTEHKPNKTILVLHTFF